MKTQETPCNRQCEIPVKSSDGTPKDSIDSLAYSRTRLLLGDDVFEAIQSKKVIIFGIGGVGSWCAEGLVRNGFRNITLVDSDTISPTNLNRQLMATRDTIGRVKTEALKERLLSINPSARIEAVHAVYDENSANDFNLNDYDYVVDAIDSLKDKTRLILQASASSATFFCSLGAALKVSPLKVKTAEYWSVRGCPLGAALRKRMKQAGTLPSKPFICVYDDEVLPNRSTLAENIEEATQPLGPNGEKMSKKAQVNGTTAHITAIFGMTICGLITEDVYKKTVNKKN